jgi:hypothetical protein
MCQRDTRHRERKLRHDQDAHLCVRSMMAGDTDADLWYQLLVV